jgi:6-phosphogluconolactonase
VDLERCAGPEEAALLTAELLADRARPGAHLVLAGGSTFLRAYELAGPLADDGGWDGVHLWYGDERCVPFDDPESNHGQVRARLQAPGATWHPMPGPDGPQEGARAYARELDGVRPDLVLLGLGPDGHTLSLFPGSALLDSTDLVAGVEDSPKPPPQRITLTLAALRDSPLVLTVTGAGKADALARVLAGPDPAVPASLLPRARLTVVADREALGG